MYYKPIPAGAYVSLEIPSNAKDGDTFDLKIQPDEGFLLDLIHLTFDIPDGVQATLTVKNDLGEFPIKEDNVNGPATIDLKAGENIPELTKIAEVHAYLKVTDATKAQGKTAKITFEGRQVIYPIPITSQTTSP